MRRPSFQFYPDDWRANANLRRCSWAARGAWADVMCLLHDSDRYGALAWPLKEIAQAVGCPLSLLTELVAKGVMKGCDKGTCEPYIYTPRSGRKDGAPIVLIAAQDGPIWYSSRMVRDEYLRTIRGDATRFAAPNGAAPDKAPKVAPVGSPKPPIGARQSDGSSSSSPSPEEETPSPPSVVRSPQGSRLPDDWRPSGDDCAFAVSLGLDPMAVGERFRDFWCAKPGKDGRKTDWPATWRNWCRRDVESRGKPFAGKPPTVLGQWADLLTAKPTADFDGHAEEVFP